MMSKKGFTLVEILIVVVILGILAAIVIPQFSDASTQAKNSSLAADLQTLRSQIELYKIQHRDAVPDTTDGTTFANSLLTATDEDGALYVAGTSLTGPFGPYMKKIPTNAFNAKSTIEIDGTAGDNAAGWYFDTTTKNIAPDDDEVNGEIAHKDM